MSTGASTAQTREISELRNHLKWLDEERRKSTRKFTDLEQKLAQQGRDLAERDQRIQELEWHIASFAERMEQFPDPDAVASAQAQRVQEMEWGLTNKTAQLEQQIAGLQGSIADLAAQLRDRTVSLAAESQTNMSALAASLQAQIDSRLTEAESRTGGVDVQLMSVQEQFESRLVEVEGILGTRLAETETRVVGVDTQVADLKNLFDARFAEAETHLGALAETLQAQIDFRLTEAESKAGGMDSQLMSVQEQFESRLVEVEGILGTRLSETETRVVGVDTQLVDLQNLFDTRLAEVEGNVGSINSILATVQGEFEPRLAEAEKVLEARLTEAEHIFQSRLAEAESILQVRLADAENNHDIRLGEAENKLETRLSEVEAKADSLNELTAGVQQQVEAQLAATEKSLIAQFQTQIDALLAETKAKVATLEESINKMGNARELMNLITRIEQDLELREAEEIRLAGLISAQETRVSPLLGSYEVVQEQTAILKERLADTEQIVAELQQTIQDYNENWKPVLLETNRRLSPLSERQTGLNNDLLKAEAAIQTLNGDHAELREIVAGLSDDIRQTQVDLSSQIDTWQTTLDEQKDTVERFSQQWIGLSTQYKEARMAVQNLAHWQKQLEQQKREASEMLRVESNRMQSRWDGFMQEVQEKLKTFEIDLGQKLQAFELENEQKWSAARRTEQLWREEITAVDDLIQKLQQDNRNMLLRVQAAQANAIKKWPRLLMEEVEKVVEGNTNRRLPSSATPSSRGDLSVADAIEQGLITVDYSDDPTAD